MFLKKVRMKTVNQLKRFIRRIDDMDKVGNINYFVDFNGELIENTNNTIHNFSVVKFAVSDHGKEFLVVDHPNPISRQDYEASKGMFIEEDENRSMKGVC